MKSNEFLEIVKHSSSTEEAVAIINRRIMEEGIECAGCSECQPEPKEEGECDGCYGEGWNACMDYTKQMAQRNPSNLVDILKVGNMRHLEEHSCSSS